MTLELNAEAPPLESGDDGAVRVRGTRIAMEVIVREFDGGASAEEIVLRYPTLSLTDTYAVIAFALRERPAVFLYMADRAARESASEAAIPSSMTRIRDRLTALRDTVG